METLRLRVQGDDVEWCDGGEVHRLPLSEAASTLQDRRLVVLVPGRDVLLAQVDIPSRRRAEIERALPYALEEWLVESPETQHFAWCQSGEHVVAAVVACARMDQWLAQLAGFGLQPERLLPETLAIPWREGEWSLVLSGDAAWLRTGAFTGLACPRASLPLLLDARLEETAQTDRPACLRLWCLDGDPPSEVALPTDLQPSPGSLVCLFQEPEPGLNLLVGRYAVHARGSERLGPWRAAVAAGVVFLVSAFALHLVEDYRLDHDVAALQQRINTLFQQAVPGVTRVVNARVQMQQALDALSTDSGGNDILSLLERSAGTLAGVQGARIVELTFQDGTITLNMTAPNIGVFETLKDRLRKQNLRVRLGTVSSQGGVGQGQLSISRGDT